MDLCPPESIADVGRGDFERVGRRWLELLKGFGLQPHHRVLDAGCGAGRIAIPLAGHLTEGTYEGFDISRPMIEWCQSHITPRFPNLHFQVADVYSKRYNPDGRSKAAAYRFPFDDGSFDFIYLTSVFTHMLPRDVDNYLGEISRVSKSGSISVITYFLLDDASREALRARRTHQRFRWPRRGYRVDSLRVPEGAVAHDAVAIDAMYDRHGLEVERREPGRWRGGDGVTAQDVLVARKP